MSSEQTSSEGDQLPDHLIAFYNAQQAIKHTLSIAKHNTGSEDAILGRTEGTVIGRLLDKAAYEKFFPYVDKYKDHLPELLPLNSIGYPQEDTRITDQPKHYYSVYFLPHSSELYRIGPFIGEKWRKPVGPDVSEKWCDEIGIQFLPLLPDGYRSPTPNPEFIGLKAIREMEQKPSYVHLVKVSPDLKFGILTREEMVKILSQTVLKAVTGDNQLSFGHYPADPEIKTKVDEFNNIKNSIYFLTILGHPTREEIVKEAREQSAVELRGKILNLYKTLSEKYELPDRIRFGNRMVLIWEEGRLVDIPKRRVEKRRLLGKIKVEVDDNENMVDLPVTAWRENAELLVFGASRMLPEKDRKVLSAYESVEMRDRIRTSFSSQK